MRRVGNRALQYLGLRDLPGAVRLSFGQGMLLGVIVIAAIVLGDILIGGFRGYLVALAISVAVQVPLLHWMTRRQHRRTES
ncbi:MAG: hypothetical protein JWM47_3670 [Acidimicrobiales bacterium]|nr:hypothetical protein [Acidimicrobiales bacterium]